MTRVRHLIWITAVLLLVIPQASFGQARVTDDAFVSSATPTSNNETPASLVGQEAPKPTFERSIPQYRLANAYATELDRPLMDSPHQSRSAKSSTTQFNGNDFPLGRRFWVLTGIAVGLTFADVELTQACLREKTCTEANPLMPESRAKAYAIQVPFTFASTYFSYRLRRSGSERWWLPQLGILMGHSVGTAANLKIRF